MRYGDSIAVCLIFCLVFSAAGQDPAALDALFRQAAERENGQGGPKDMAAAARLYEQAASQGHVPSMVRLGYLRQSGAGVPQDLPGAFALFSGAAKAGNPDGQFLLAMSYAQGAGTAKDPVSARNWLLQPAAAGYQHAQYALGIMLETGEGGPKREAAARRWLDKAAAGPDRAIAVRAADLRDKIDKNLFAPDNSGMAFLGLAAFILIAGALVGGDGGGGGSVPTGNTSGGSSSSGATKPWTRPAHCYPVPVMGTPMVPSGNIFKIPAVGTAMHCD